MSRNRKEFSAETKRQALKRSGNLCEAMGARYGLRPGQRCNAPLSFGVEFDHGNPDGNGGGNNLENCVCACIRCHDWKTRNVDVPMIAKGKRQWDKSQGVRKSKGSFPTRMDAWGNGRRTGGNVRDINADIGADLENQ